MTQQVMFRRAAISTVGMPPVLFSDSKFLIEHNSLDASPLVWRGRPRARPGPFPWRHTCLLTGNRGLVSQEQDVIIKVGKVLEQFGLVVEKLISKECACCTT